MEETKNTFKAHIIPRSGTAASWELANPVLLKGEMGVESDTGRFKFGDGVTPWHGLAYSGERGEIGNLEIGGRNLLLSSGVELQSSQYRFAQYYLSERIYDGQDVTLTVWGELDDSVDYITPYNSGGMLHLMLPDEARIYTRQIKETGKGSITFKWRTDYNLFHYTQASCQNTDKYGNYAFKQITADDHPYLRWKLQGYTTNGEYIGLCEQVILEDIGRHFINFTVPQNRKFNYFRFGLNGLSIDSLVCFSGLTPGDYTLSFYLDQNTQGEVVFGRIKIVSGYDDRSEWRLSLLDSEGSAPANDSIVMWAFNADGSQNLTTKTVRRIQLECGNAATDWTPSPEDSIPATQIIEDNNHRFVTLEEKSKLKESSVKIDFFENGDDYQVGNPIYLFNTDNNNKTAEITGYEYYHTNGNLNYVNYNAGASYTHKLCFCDFTPGTKFLLVNNSHELINIVSQFDVVKVLSVDDCVMVVILPGYSEEKIGNISFNINQVAIIDLFMLK